MTVGPREALIASRLLWTFSCRILVGGEEVKSQNLSATSAFRRRAKLSLPCWSSQLFKTPLYALVHGAFARKVAKSETNSIELNWYHKLISTYFTECLRRVNPASRPIYFDTSRNSIHTNSLWSQAAIPRVGWRYVALQMPSYDHGVSRARCPMMMRSARS
jgi:hypothetical protein